MSLGAIGGVVSGIGSIIGGKSQSKAASRAADTSLAVANQNNALARDIYGQNAARLDPYSNTGLQANNALAALYGIGGGAQQQTLPGYGPQTGTASFNQPASLYGPNPGAVPGAPYSGSVSRADLINSNSPHTAIDDTRNAFFNRLGSQGYQISGGAINPATPGIGDGIPGNPSASSQMPQQTNPLEAQQNAFQAFRDSTGYQHQVDEAERALQSRFASMGIGQSGAAVKALSDRRQSIADNSFQQYAAGLGSLANRGAGAASSIAGVGQNFVSNVSANNNAAGTAAANAALARGNINANMWGGVGNALGQIVGGFGGSSYGK